MCMHLCLHMCRALTSLCISTPAMEELPALPPTLERLAIYSKLVKMLADDLPASLSALRCFETINLLRLPGGCHAVYYSGALC